MSPLLWFLAGFASCGLVWLGWYQYTTWQIWREFDMKHFIKRGQVIMAQTVYDVFDDTQEAAPR